MDMTPAAADPATADFLTACDALAADPGQADVLKVRMATCPLCKGWVMQSAYPRCLSSKESQREFAACMRAGMDISTVTFTEARQVKHCTHLADGKRTKRR